MSQAMHLTADRATVVRFIEEMKAAFDDDQRIKPSEPLSSQANSLAPKGVKEVAGQHFVDDSEPDDLGPHPHCPTYFGAMPPTIPDVCNDCDLWWDCRRQSGL